MLFAGHLIANSGNYDVSTLLLRLWIFLPGDLVLEGAPKDRQMVQIAEITQRTSCKERRDIDRFLNHIVTELAI